MNKDDLFEKYLREKLEDISRSVEKLETKLDDAATLAANEISSLKQTTAKHSVWIGLTAAGGTGIVVAVVTIFVERLAGQ